MLNSGTEAARDFHKAGLEQQIAETSVEGDSEEARYAAAATRDDR